MPTGIKLNEKQTIAFGLMAEGKSVFLTGPGGVGKTALIKLFWDRYYLDRKIAITSTTGTSALLIQGTTIHSYLGIGTGAGTTESMVMKIQKMKWLRDRWLSLKCLVIDEISMLDPDVWDKLEHVARIIRRSPHPWGGIQLVISGDFLQLPCVGTDQFCFQASSWNRCLPNTVYLTEIIRQKDQIFQRCLNSIRVGDITEEVTKTLLTRVGAQIINKYNITPTKLYSTNYEVDHVNNIELDKLGADGRQFYEYNMNFATKVKGNLFDKFKKHCNAQEIVQLCVGAQVMLLKNLDMESGLVNGSRGVITEFYEDDTPVVRFLNGVVRAIEVATWDVMENEKCVLTMEQIPLKAAYAISIHKSQGCSLDCVEIDLGNIFENGQAYVALSRVKSLQGLSLVDVSFEKIRAHPMAVEYYNSLLADSSPPKHPRRACSPTRRLHSDGNVTWTSSSCAHIEGILSPDNTLCREVLDEISPQSKDVPSVASTPGGDVVINRMDPIPFLSADDGSLHRVSGYRDLEESIFYPPKKTGVKWTANDDLWLCKVRSHPIEVIAKKSDRSVGAIRSRLKHLDDSKHSAFKRLNDKNP